VWYTQGTERGCPKNRTLHVMAKHTHKYIRATLKYASVWRCALPDCTHFIPKHQEPLIEGRYSFCWGCGERFILDEDALKEDMPRCFTCRHPSLVEEFDVDEYIGRMTKDKL
jgi:hypothetical protein